METPDYTAPTVATDRDSLRRELMAIARGDRVTDRERIVLGAAICAIREAAAPPDIDYAEMIEAAFKRHKYAQGTGACIAFARGAQWMRDQMAS